MKRLNSKKNINVIFLLLVAILLTVFLLTACQNNKAGIVVLTFDANADDALFDNGEKFITKQVRINSEFDRITETPKRKGFVFVGWFMDKDGKSAIMPNFLAKKSITIYAHWIDVKEYEHEVKIDTVENCEISFYQDGSEDSTKRAKYDTEVRFNVFPTLGYKVKNNSLGYYYLEDDNKIFKSIEYSDSNPQTFKMPAHSVIITAEIVKIQYAVQIEYAKDSLKFDAAQVYLSSNSAGFDEEIMYSVIPNYNNYIKDITLTYKDTRQNQQPRTGIITMGKFNPIITLDIGKIDFSKEYGINFSSNLSLSFEQLNVKSSASVGEFVFIDLNNIAQDYEVISIKVNDVEVNSMSGFYMPQPNEDQSSINLHIDVEELDKTKTYGLTIENDSDFDISADKTSYKPGDEINLQISNLAEQELYIESIFLNRNPVSFDSIYMPSKDSTISINIKSYVNKIKLEYDKEEGDVLLSYNQNIDNPNSESQLKVYIKPSNEYMISGMQIGDQQITEKLFQKKEGSFDFDIFGLYYVYIIDGTCDFIKVSFSQKNETNKNYTLEYINNEDKILIDSDAKDIYKYDILNLKKDFDNKDKLGKIQVSYFSDANTQIGNHIDITAFNSLLINPPDNTNKIEIKVILKDLPLSLYKIEDYIGSTVNPPMKIDLISSKKFVNAGTDVVVYVKNFSPNKSYRVTYADTERIISPSDGYDSFTVNNVVGDTKFEVQKVDDDNRDIMISAIVKDTQGNPILKAIKISGSNDRGKFKENDRVLISVEDNYKHQYYISEVSIEDFTEDKICSSFTILTKYLTPINNNINLTIILKEKDIAQKEILEIYQKHAVSPVFNSCNYITSYRDKLDILKSTTNFGIEFCINYISSIVNIKTLNNLDIFVFAVKDRKVANELLSLIKGLLDTKHNLISDAYIAGNHIIISYVGIAKEIYYSLCIDSGFAQDQQSNLIYYTLSDDSLGLLSYTGKERCVIIPVSFDNKYISGIENVPLKTKFVSNNVENVFL